MKRPRPSIAEIDRVAGELIETGSTDRYTGLSNSRLPNSNLPDSNLPGSNLSNSNLSDSNLSNSDLVSIVHQLEWECGQYRDAWKDCRARLLAAKIESTELQLEKRNRESRSISNSIYHLSRKEAAEQARDDMRQACDDMHRQLSIWRAVAIMALVGIAAGIIILVACLLLNGPVNSGGSVISSTGSERTIPGPKMGTALKWASPQRAAFVFVPRATRTFPITHTFPIACIDTTCTFIL